MKGIRNSEFGIRNELPKEMRNAECGMRNELPKERDLKKRSKQFSLAVIKFVEALSPGDTCRVLGRQLLRSGTSVSANYRAACRARSTADFINKLGYVEEEADESAHWLELLLEDGKVSEATARPLIREAYELCAIAIASINTARKGTR